jgi:cell wall-associated NlpC family hydrolase
VIGASVVLLTGSVVWAAPAGAAGSHDQGQHGRAFPSKHQVNQARTRASDARGRVSQIETALTQANQELQDASVRAEQAYEAYNGARWELHQATQELKQAQAAARGARQHLARQRDRLAVLIASTYQQGGGIGALDAVLGHEGPQGLMSRLLAYQGASTSFDAKLQRFSATASLAKVFRAKARTARAHQQEQVGAAARAKDAAVAAAAEAQQLAAQVAAQKKHLVAEMARLQGISVRMAQRRQTALEVIAQRRAAHQAWLEQQRQQREQQRQAQQDQSPQPTGSPPSGGTSSSPTTQPAPQPAPQPDPSPPAPAGGAQRAIQFAKAQLGEPYVWGAAGPDAWDCSGLTMRSWEAGGVSLPHYSVAQYAESTPISASQLRPGDLVFWGTTSSPSSIHHVAMYLGNGMIIQAPHTGAYVDIVSMYSWIPPNFFGRV